jgi:putative aminopeptidase FrvX
MCLNTDKKEFILDKTELLLKELTEAKGVSGYEREVRSVIRGEMNKLGEMSQDKLGSLICRQEGGSAGPRVMIAAHMDEIGFMVKLITKEGFLKFTPLGGWSNQVLLAQPVNITTHKGNVLGVIGSKPPHLMNEDERKKMVEKKEMFIDIGATSLEEVEEAGVHVGDPVTPVCDFRVLDCPKKTYMAKAFDDRAGVALVITVLNNLSGKHHPNTVFGVLTVQEEVGVRGATTSVDAVNPDVAIVVDVDIAGDVPGIKPEESAIKMGGGPTVLAYDARMIPNLKLRDLVIDLARQQGIPLQVSTMEGGATDGSAIHLHKTGVPTVVLSVPTRHIHSHNSMMRRDDFDLAVRLATELVLKLDSATVSALLPL